MKTLILAALRYSLMFFVTASPFLVPPVQAYTVTLQQVGSNVVATGSGAIDLTGLTFRVSGTLQPGVIVANCVRSSAERGQSYKEDLRDGNWT